MNTKNKDLIYFTVILRMIFAFFPKNQFSSSALLSIQLGCHITDEEYIKIVANIRK